MPRKKRTHSEETEGTPPDIEAHSEEAVDEIAQALAEALVLEAVAEAQESTSMAGESQWGGQEYSERSEQVREGAIESLLIEIRNLVKLLERRLTPEGGQGIDEQDREFATAIKAALMVPQAQGSLPSELAELIGGLQLQLPDLDPSARLDLPGNRAGESGHV